MFSRLLPKNYGFFDLFDKHATATLEAVKILYEILESLPSKNEKIVRIGELEHECDSLTHMTIELLRKTFITPFDREEIRLLISRMDDIVDYAHAVANRIEPFEINEAPPEMVKLCKVLLKAQEQVVEAVKLLRKMKESKELHDICKEINSLENEGDKLHREGLAALFHNQRDPMQVIKLKDIYAILEEAVDSSEDVANVVEGIIIEHES